MLRRTIVSVVFAALLSQTATYAQVDDGTIVVGLIDTGVNTDGNNLNVITDLSTDFLANNGSFFDGTDIQHGTTSALIIDEQSPGVAIAALKTTDSNFFSTQAAVDAAVNSTVGNSNIRVLSLSEGAKGFSSAMGPASDAGKFISIQSGNGFADEPNAMASAHYVLPGVVIVGGTDADGNILPQSNRAGQTMERYIATPGVTSFSGVFGTSFAAARIAGIGAAVFAQNPTLTGEDVAQVIFRSAVDRGDPGTDAVYGRGFVFDAQQVIDTIVGETTVATNPTATSGTGGSGGGGSSGAGIALVIGGVAAGALVLGRGGDELEKTLILDSYGRPFEVDLGELVTVADRNANVASFFDALDEQYGAMRVRTGLQNSFVDIRYSTLNTRPVEFDRYHAINGDVVWTNQDVDYSFSFAGGTYDGFQYQLNYNTNPQTQFSSIAGAESQHAINEAVFLSGQTFSSPVMGFSARADSAAIRYPLSSKWNVQMGVVSVDEGQEYGLESTSALIQLGYRLGARGALDFQFGQLDENRSLFGGSNGGAFGVDNAETWAFNVTGHYQLSDKLFLVGNLGQGISSINDAEESLLYNFSSVRSEWFGVGLIAQDVFTDGDRAGLAWSQPMRIVSGEVDYAVPYALDADRNVLKNINRISLVSDGAERKLEAYYRRMIGNFAEVGAFMMMRSEPEHVRDAKTDYSAMLTLRLIAN